MRAPLFSCLITTCSPDKTVEYYSSPKLHLKTKISTRKHVPKRTRWKKKHFPSSTEKLFKRLLFCLKYAESKKKDKTLGAFTRQTKVDKLTIRLRTVQVNQNRSCFCGTNSFCRQIICRWSRAIHADIPRACFTIIRIISFTSHAI